MALEVVLLQAVQDGGRPAPTWSQIHVATCRPIVVVLRGEAAAVAGGKRSGRIVIIVQSQPDLLEVVLANRQVGGGAHLLHGREQQADQNGDNSDYDEQFDECKARADPGAAHRRHLANV